MANGLITFPGSYAPAGVAPPRQFWGLPRTLIWYVWDTAIGAAFTAGQFNDMLAGGFLLPGGGVWRCEFVASRAAMASELSTSLALSVNSGNTTTDHVVGNNEMPIGETAAAVDSGMVRWLFTSNTDLTIFAKFKQTGGVSASNVTGSFLAERL